MKTLLAVAITAYACWLVSDLIELLTGEYGSAVVYLTALFHLLAGVGIWGLYLALLDERRKLLLLGSAMASIGHLALALLPLHVHRSGHDLTLILGEFPIYIAWLVCWSLGILAFSTAAIRSLHCPAWIGWLMLSGFSGIIMSRPLNWPTLAINLVTIVLSALMIYLCVLAWPSNQDSRR